MLEALRILEGHQTDAGTSLAGVFQALEKKDYALLIMDLNYTRDTTSGQEGLEVIPRIVRIILLACARCETSNIQRAFLISRGRRRHGW